MKSKKALAFEKFKFSDPGWNAEVIPIAGSTSVAIFAASVDKYTGRRCTGSSSLHMPIGRRLRRYAES